MAFALQLLEAVQSKHLCLNASARTVLRGQTARVSVKINVAAMDSVTAILGVFVTVVTPDLTVLLSKVANAVPNPPRVALLMENIFAGYQINATNSVVW